MASKSGSSLEPHPRLEEFLRDPSLSGDATEEETEFLNNLRIDGRRPTPSIITGNCRI
jgi:hypothetical protein